MKTLIALLFSSTLAMAQLLPSGFGVRTIDSYEVSVLAHKTPQSAGIVAIVQSTVRQCAGTCFSVPTSSGDELQGVLLRVKYMSAGKTFTVKRMLLVQPKQTQSTPQSGATTWSTSPSLVGYLDTTTLPESVLDVSLEEVHLVPQREK